jgi:hypothetical protein
MNNIDNNIDNNINKIKDDIKYKINNYVSQVFDKNSKDMISKIDYNGFIKLLNLYTSQSIINYNEYMIFSLYKNNNEIEIVPTHSFSTVKDFNSYQVIYYDPIENSYLAQLYNITDFYKTIIETTNKYVFFKLCMIFKNENTGHSTLIIIDKEDKSCKFFDANGYNGSKIKSEIIDKLLETYINIFNITCNEYYTYISTDDWMYGDKNHYILNDYILKNETITAGHCVIFTIIVAHILSITNYTLNQIIFALKNIENNKLFDLIMGYTQTAIENLNHKHMLK